MNKWIVFFGLGLLASAQVCSASEGSHGHSHKAHTHGVVDLMLVKEGEELQIQFESPAVNMLGFEHAAQTEEEKQAVAQAKRSLESAEEIFAFSDEACSPQKSEVSFSGAIEENDHSENEGYDDDHAHSGHSHDEHSDDGEHSHEKHESKHSEVTASYRFTCKAGGELKSVSTMLLTLFPRIEKVNVSWINEASQGAATLHGGESEILLK